MTPYAQFVLRNGGGPAFREPTPLPVPMPPPTRPIDPSAALIQAQRAQRQAYFAWQNEPAGESAMREAYVLACHYLDEAERAAGWDKSTGKWCK